jgi:sugar transferase (PEP-CTERM system associated)
LRDASLAGRRHVLLILVESGLMLMVLLGAAVLRLGPDQRGGLPLLVAAGAANILALQLCLYYGEVYDDRARRSRTEFFVRLLRSFLLATLLLPLIYYLLPPLRLEPGLLMLFLPLAVGIVVLWHGLIHWAGGREALLDNVLILGTGHSARQVAVELLRRAPLGYRVVGFLGEHPHEVGRSLVNPGVVGTITDLRRLVPERKVSLIVVALDDQRGRLPVDELLRCRVDGVQVEDAPTFYERLTGKLLVSDLRPSWLVFSPGFRKPRLVLASKRAVELVAAVVLLVVGAPLLLLLAALIRLDSPGRVLYAQKRVGKGGRVFDLYKLRTMRHDAEAASGPVWAAPENDRRVTRVGRLLRKLRLDELPQLWNVLRGDMSFVGPRPERPHFVEQLRKVIPFYDERHHVLPGITGWAQVKFGYGSTIEDSERKLQFDLYYIKNMSLFLDAAIVLDTLKEVLVGRGAR